MRLIPTLLVLLVGGASVPFAQAQTQPLTPGDSCPSTGGYVDCRDGIAYANGSSTGQTCYAACSDGALCCDGGFACKYTTACIEKSSSANPAVDRPCSGEYACYYVGNANSKPIISSGSCRGINACRGLAFGGGSVTSIVRSCTADNACYDLAVFGGSVGAITGSCCTADSCREYCKAGSTSTTYPTLTCAQNQDLTSAGGCPLTTGDSCPSTGDYVDCRGGIAYANGSSTSQTCYAACNDGALCCDGNLACAGTTACIKKSSSANPAVDRPCSGFEACYNIGSIGSKPIISSGSCRGLQACYGLAALGGSVTSIENSCTADSACTYVALNRGSVTFIKDSCTAIAACLDLARSGNVKAITGSCCTADSCREYCKAGSTSTTYPTLTCAQNQDLTSAGGCPLTTGDSCPSTGDYVDCRGGIAFDPITQTSTGQTCYAACSDGALCCDGDLACAGTMACIEKSSSANRPCSGPSACYNIGYNGNNIGSKPIISSGSCRGLQACYDLAALGGSVTSIENSCTADNACYDLAYEGGSVTSIEDSCTEDSACQSLAQSGNVKAITGSCCTADSCREYCKAGSTSTTYPTLTCAQNQDLTSVGGCPVSTTPTVTGTVKTSFSVNTGGSSGGGRRLQVNIYGTVIEEKLLDPGYNGLPIENDFRLKAMVDFSSLSGSTASTVTADINITLSCGSNKNSCGEALDNVRRAQSTFVDGLSANIKNGTFGNDLKQTFADNDLGNVTVDPTSFSSEYVEPNVKGGCTTDDDCDDPDLPKCDCGDGRRKLSLRKGHLTLLQEESTSAATVEAEYGPDVDLTMYRRAKSSKSCSPANSGTCVPKSSKGLFNPP